MRKECVVGLIDKLINDTKESKDVEDTLKRVCILYKLTKLGRENMQREEEDEGV